MTLTRRKWLKGAAAALPGLAVAELVDSKEVRAAARSLKLAGVKEYTTACNFCSCGCGMVAQVKDGKLVSLEGDPDHVVNQGSLCAKGAAMREAHESSQRLTTPLFRAAGSDKFVEISWDEALEKVAKKMKAVRDSSWIPTEKVGDQEIVANRTDAIGFLGGAQNTNEEAYLFAKMSRLIGTPFIEHQARV